MSCLSFSIFSLTNKVIVSIHYNVTLCILRITILNTKSTKVELRKVTFLKILIIPYCVLKYFVISVHADFFLSGQLNAAENYERFLWHFCRNIYSHE